MSTDVFAVVADPTRRRILDVVKEGPSPVNDVVTELGVSQPTVSKHLKVLREAGLVTMKAQGQKRLYSLNPEPLQEIRAWIEGLSASSVERDDAENSGETESTEQAEPAAAEPTSRMVPQPEKVPSSGREDSAAQDSPPSPARPHLAPRTGSEEHYGADPEPTDVEEQVPAVPVVAQATGTDGASSIHRTRHDGVTFRPLMPLGLSVSGREDDPAPTTSDFSSTPAAHESEVSTEPSASRPVTTAAQGESASEDAPSTSGPQSWEPLDPKVHRADSASDDEAASDDHKASGFLANLFARRRGR
ncbi:MULTISPECIES: metalloregulator ArsR/SmtB family transcription factor [Kocuria]|uniref:metalloregulator ArsR/SmtB family transcription factor n=1 Tax=Kocuria TaxID=57493 RepID=UPI0009E5F55A|nr:MULTISPECIES: metalloregulator ArsR/SmtB family transcription factor [Kocuria]RUQ23304.1 ArsR family transcriptional regulator [Kocuria sp. HSID16901]